MTNDYVRRVEAQVQAGRLSCCKPTCRRIGTRVLVNEYDMSWGAHTRTDVSCHVYCDTHYEAAEAAKGAGL